MKNKVCNKKTDKTTKKNISNYTNQNNGNSNTPFIHLKFVNFVLIIDQII